MIATSEKCDIKKKISFKNMYFEKKALQLK